MPSTRQMRAILRPVTAWTRCRSAVFFYLVPCGLENLDLQDFLAQRALQFPDPLLGRPQLAGRHDLLVGHHGRCAPSAAQALPLAHQLRGHRQLAGQLRHREFLSAQARDLLLLELRGEDPTTICLPPMRFPPTILPWEVNVRFPTCLVESGYRAGMKPWGLSQYDCR